MADDDRNPASLAGARVVQVVATTVGGTGAHVAMLVDLLQVAGASVTVCGPPEVDDLFGFSARGAVFWPVPVRSRPSPADLVSLRRLRRLGRGASVVHAHSLRAAALCGMALPRRVPLVVTRHNAVLATGPSRRVSLALQRYTARRADVTMCVSDDLVTAVRAAGGTDVRRTFVTAPALGPPARDRSTVRRELAAADRPLVLALGRLHRQKDYPTLVAAAGQLRDLDPVPLVVVAGDGPERATLQRIIADSRAPVRLLGDRRDAADLLCAADVLVQSSVWEAGSFAVQEALRVGLPVVATRVGAIGDLVGSAGLLVPPGQPDALAEQLRRVLEQPTLAADLRELALRRAAELPTDADVVAAVAAAYATARGSRAA